MSPLLREPRRLAASALAIVLGVAFTCATLLLGTQLERSYGDRVAGRLGDATVVVDASRGGGVTAATLDRLAGQPGVTATRAYIDSYVSFSTGLTAGLVTLPELSARTVLLGGRLPAAPGEVAVNEALAKQAGLGPDGRLTVMLSADTTAVLTITGVLRPGSDATANPAQPQAYAANRHLLPYVNGRYALVMLTADGDPGVLAGRLAALPALQRDQLIPETADAYRTRLIGEYAHGTGAVTALLLSFSVIAFVVAALVIANTFGILVAQRTRQLALLRCLGAARAQVFGQVLAEAAATAAVAGLAGVGLGVALVALLPVAAPATFDYQGVSVTPVGLFLPWVAGVAVTSVAALPPARAATQVAPLAALRPDPTGAGTHPVRRVRFIAGLAVGALGAGLLAAGVTLDTLPIGLAGGTLSFLGVLLVGPTVVPAIIGVLGAPFARRLTGRLAIENARRNPHRAATTAGALLIGTTLVVTVLVGAASGQASAFEAIERRYPADALIHRAGGVQESVRETVAAQPGVAAAVLAPSAMLELSGPGLPPGFISVSLTALGLGEPDAARLGYGQVVAGLTDREIVVPRSLGIADGAPVRVAPEGRPAVEFTARTVPQAGLIALTPSALAGLAPRPDSVLLIDFAEGADQAAATGRLRDVLPADGRTSITSMQAERRSVEDAVGIAVGVVLGLLAVSVAISLVGVGNTLGLSVLERTRETALLRALGLDRVAVRRLLGGEALLLGAVAGLLGVALGIGYGLAGAVLLLGSRIPVNVTLPWTQLAAVAALTLASAWLASVLPGRRAAAVAPAAALADE